MESATVPTMLPSVTTVSVWSSRFSSMARHLPDSLRGGSKFSSTMATVSPSPTPRAPSPAACSVARVAE